MKLVYRITTYMKLVANFFFGQEVHKPAFLAYVTMPSSLVCLTIPEVRIDGESLADALKAKGLAKDYNWEERRLER